MDFYEVEGKKLLTRYGVPTDNGILYNNDICLSDVSYPIVVKAQVLSGKRGKAGGIKFAENEFELKEAIKSISDLVINDKKIQGILLSPKINITKEHYLGITIDSIGKQIMLIYSPYGGMDIEQLAIECPEKLIRISLNKDFDTNKFLDYLKRFNLEDIVVKQLIKISEQLINMFLELDATTIEINPLAQLEDGMLTAADCKLVIDDNALYRQGDYTLIPRVVELTGVNKLADEYGLSYVVLDEYGNIGVIAGGAGLGMATVDTLKFYGEKPYNFMDLGGGVTKEKTCIAVKILLENPKVNALLINIFGGINNCLVMAEGIERAILESDSNKVVVVKSRGFNQEEGWAILDGIGVNQVHFGTTDDAVKLLKEKLEVTK